MFRSRRFVLITALVALPALLALAGCTTRYGSQVLRPSDPVVLTGAALPKLVGGAPQHIVGFAWDGSAWHQIPVQVDERDMVNPGPDLPPADVELPHALRHHDALQDPRVHAARPPQRRVHVERHLHAQRLRTRTFDANDELSFLASDTGKQVAGSAANPSGVDGEHPRRGEGDRPVHAGVRGLRLPLPQRHADRWKRGDHRRELHASAWTRELHRHVQDGDRLARPEQHLGLQPRALDRRRRPRTTRRSATGGSTTGSSVTTPGATGADILDRSHYYVTVGCGRTEDTFDGGANNPGEGAFIANISGPVRAIRSYLGANSYTWTANTDIFYPNRQDTVTELRGHAGLPGYGAPTTTPPGTTGLTYSDPANTGITIDGTPDAVTPIAYTTGRPAPAMWQLVAGAQGSVVTVRTLDTNISGLNVTSVYQDRNPATPAQCTGDAAAWGQNGVNVTSPVNNVPVTDPTLTATPAKLHHVPVPLLRSAEPRRRRRREHQPAGAEPGADQRRRLTH